MTNLSPKQKHRFQNQGRHKNSIHDQVDRTISRNKSSRSEMKITPCDCSHNKDIGVKEQAMGIVLQFTNKEWPRTHQNLRRGGKPTCYSGAKGKFIQIPDLVIQLRITAWRP